MSHPSDKPSLAARTGEPPALRVLITRLSAIGDAILTLPLACALRQRFPHCQITWLVEPAAGSLLAGHPCIDRLIVVRRKWLKHLSEFRRVRREVRALRCDVVLDPQSLTKSSLAGWLAGAPLRIGFARPQGRELSLLFNNRLIHPTADHLVDRQLELLRPLGIENPQVEFRLPRDEVAVARIDDFCRAAHLGRGFAVINPGAGWKSRLWLVARYGKVARHLGEQWNLPTVVTWGGTSELALAQEICQAAGGRALLAPDTKLRELAELLRRAEIYIGSDSGPLHLASAVGTPCVGLHGPTRPEHSGAYGPGHRSLQAFYQARTRGQRKTADNGAMRAITIEAVCAACDELLHAKQKSQQLRCVA